MPKWVGLLFVTLAVVAGVGFLWWKMSVEQSTLKLGGTSYHMTVLRTDEERQKGLSGTQSLPAGEAMVFAFPSDGRWGIWMKDMNYPIDIIWLDSDRKVVYFVKDAKPSSYPNTIYTPDVDTRYVIELPSGTIERTGIQKGEAAGMPSGI